MVLLFAKAKILAAILLGLADEEGLFVIKEIIYAETTLKRQRP